MQPELTVRKRLLVLLIVLMILFAGVGARVVDLTVIQAESLTAKGVAQWVRKGIVSAQRGSILDCNGEVLVASVTAFIVSATPKRITDPEALLDALCPLLNIDRENALKKITDKSKATVILKRQVSREVVDQIRQLMTQEDIHKRKVFTGLTFDEDVRRWYPRGTFLSAVLGLTNVDSVGQSGLEQQYEDILRGQAGAYVTSVDAKSRQLADGESVYVAPQPGDSLKLTIDANIQEFCERAMRECVAVNGAKAVHCIVMDTRTGAILAMSSKPDYDPNDPPRNDVKALTELMRIRLISDVYEPGSTFKILTSAAALDCGATTPEDSFYCSGKIKVSGDTIRCWGNPHGAETMRTALQNSCNPVFVELALRIGQDRFYQYLRAFGLGEKTGLTLPGEEKGILINARLVKDVDLARIGFGQSVAVTPLQLLTAACAAINGGKLMKPYIVSEVVDQAGETVFRQQPQVVATPITAETSATMRELLEGVVEEGGGRKAAILGYRIGGKTGTAQVYKDGKIVRDMHIGSFLGFAPADNPRFAILTIVDEATVAVDYGSATAAPFARQVMESILAYMDIQPVYAATPVETVRVPNIIGLTVGEAKKELQTVNLALQTDGAGEKITDQIPAAGSSLQVQGQVMAYTYTVEPLETQDMVSVPDVTGLSMLEAGRLLTSRTLLLEISGTGLAVSQEPIAGAYVPLDTVVRVTFKMP